MELTSEGRRIIEDAVGHYHEVLFHYLVERIKQANSEVMNTNSNCHHHCIEAGVSMGRILALIPALLKVFLTQAQYQL